MDSAEVMGAHPRGILLQLVDHLHAFGMPWRRGVALP